MKRLVFAASAAGTGAAGGLVAVSQLNVQAASVFSVQWSAYMIFVVVIGGMGSIEGPILGAAIFFALQQSLSGYGAWYLILVGLIAIFVALELKRGLWGLIAEHAHLSFFNTGYWLVPEEKVEPAARPRTAPTEAK
jgi:branched-chain amino acid transport system permease protein